MSGAPGVAAVACFLVACTPGSTAAPRQLPAADSAAVPAPTASASSEVPPTSSEVHPTSSEVPPASSAPPFDIAGSGVRSDALPAALGARLAREADAIPKGKLELHPKTDAERDRAIAASFGSDCRLERTCGPLWGIDCQAAVDGPYYYARPRADHIERITICGGACMSGRCTNCPPRAQGWTCAVY